VGAEARKVLTSRYLNDPEGADDDAADERRFPVVEVADDHRNQTGEDGNLRHRNATEGTGRAGATTIEPARADPLLGARPRGHLRLVFGAVLAPLRGDRAGCGPGPPALPGAALRTLTGHGKRGLWHERLDDRGDRPPREHRMVFSNAADATRVHDMSAQKPLELILARNLLSSLSTPAFLAGDDATLLFYNDAAGVLIGRRFEETGAMPSNEWTQLFGPFDENGEPINLRETPLTLALRDGRPHHAKLRIRVAGGTRQDVEASAIPIVGSSGSSGAIVIFWPADADESA
jgi:PAS domain-containing protein